MKSIEQMTGCKIQIRGEGSIPAHREHELRGKEGWEHLNDVLHVYIETCGKEPLASLALERGKRMIQEMLVPVVFLYICRLSCPIRQLWIPSNSNNYAG